MAQSNLSKIYMKQGAAGPEQAKRPDDEALIALRALPHNERLGVAGELAAAGCTVDAPVDVNAWDYWKTMEQRRQYGYTWVPAGDMANILIAPGLWMPGGSGEGGLRYDADNPPVGAILVPKSATEDPNHETAKPVTPPPPPPDGQAVFGPPIEHGDFAGCYYVGAENTVPPGSHATRDGQEYVYIVIGQIGTLNYRKLWAPTELVEAHESA